MAPTSFVDRHVNSEADNTLASSEIANIDGIKTVLNNLSLKGGRTFDQLGPSVVGTILIRAGENLEELP